MRSERNDASECVTTQTWPKLAFVAHVEVASDRRWSRLRVRSERSVLLRVGFVERLTFACQRISVVLEVEHSSKDLGPVQVSTTRKVYV